MKTTILNYSNFRICLLYFILAKEYMFSVIMDHKGTMMIIQARFLVLFLRNKV